MTASSLNLAKSFLPDSEVLTPIREKLRGSSVLQLNRIAIPKYILTSIADHWRG